LVLKSLKDESTIRMIICDEQQPVSPLLVQSIIEYSKLIKSIRIMAPTGIATFNIGGYYPP